MAGKHFETQFIAYAEKLSHQVIMGFSCPMCSQTQIPLAVFKFLRRTCSVEGKHFTRRFQIFLAQSRRGSSEKGKLRLVPIAIYSMK